MKKINRIISLLLAVLMLLSASAVFTVSADADLPFTDVSPNAWYTEAIRYCYSKNYVSGTSPTTFNPAGNLTRAQFVVLLANIAGADISVYQTVESGFRDVTVKHWFHNAVTWASHRGYVAGTGEKQFSPNAMLTREQLARIFYVYSEKNGYDVASRADLSRFTDAAKISSWAKDQVSWAVSKGIINGMTATTVAPRGNATRAQAAQIIMTYTTIDFALNINRFRAFASELDPYIPDDAEYWAPPKVFQNYEVISTSTEVSGKTTYNYSNIAEFVHYDKPDVMTFMYTEKVESTEDGVNFEGYKQIYGAVYQGKTEVVVKFRDIETYNSFTAFGSFTASGGYNYTITNISGYKFTEAEAKAIVDTFIPGAIAALDSQSKKICGYRFISVVNAAPKYATLDGMTDHNKVLYSLPIDLEYYNEISYSNLEYRYDCVDNGISTDDGYKNDRATVNLSYNLDNESYSVYYIEDKSSKEDGVYTYRNTIITIDMDKEPATVYLSHDDGDKRYSAQVTVSANGSYTFEIRSNKNMTVSECNAHAKSFIDKALKAFNDTLKPMGGVTVADLCN